MQGTSEPPTLAPIEGRTQSSSALQSSPPAEKTSHPISVTQNPEESTETSTTAREAEVVQETEPSTLAPSERERLSSPTALPTVLSKTGKTRQFPTEPTSAPREQDGKSSTPAGEPEATQESRRSTQAMSEELEPSTTAVPKSSLMTETTHRTSEPLPTTHEEEGTKPSVTTKEQQTMQSTSERSIRTSKKESLSTSTALPTAPPRLSMTTKITEHTSTTRQDGKRSTSAGKPQATQGTSERPTIALKEMEHTPSPSALPRVSTTRATTTRPFEHSSTTVLDQKEGIKPSTEARGPETTQETLKLPTETLEQRNTPSPRATSTSSEPDVTRRTESTPVNIENEGTVSSGTPSGSGTTQWPRDPPTIGLKEKEPILSSSAPTETHVMETTQRPAELTTFSEVESESSFSEAPGVSTELIITSPIKSTISDSSTAAHMTSSTSSTSRITELSHSATTTAGPRDELGISSQTPAVGKTTQIITELPTTQIKKTTQGFSELDIVKTTQEVDESTERLREESTANPSVLLTSRPRELEITQEPSEHITESSGDNSIPESGVNTVSPDESTRTEPGEGLTSSFISREKAGKTTQTPTVQSTVKTGSSTTPHGELKEGSTSQSEKSLTEQPNESSTDAARVADVEMPVQRQTSLAIQETAQTTKQPIQVRAGGSTVALSSSSKSKETPESMEPPTSAPTTLVTEDVVKGDTLSPRPEGGSQTIQPPIKERKGEQDTSVGPESTPFFGISKEKKVELGKSTQPTSAVPHIQTTPKVNEPEQRETRKESSETTPSSSPLDHGPDTTLRSGVHTVAIEEITMRPSEEKGTLEPNESERSGEAVSSTSSLGKTETTKRTSEGFTGVAKVETTRMKSEKTETTTRAGQGFTTKARTETNHISSDEMKTTETASQVSTGET
ncbi:unnamed protein product, partial [Cylicostephanus goldi]